MIVDLYIPESTDPVLLGILDGFYPDFRGNNGGCHDETHHWWVGSDEGEEDEVEPEYLTANEAVECCGFVEGLIDEAEAVIDGNGPWAMSMIRRKDFSDYRVMSETEKAAWQENSDRYWAAFQRGRDARPVAAGN